MLDAKQPELPPSNPPPAAVEPAPFRPMRFDMGSLFVLTALCAVGIALVRQLEIWGTVILFIAGGLASLWLRKNPIPTGRFWLQAIWGVLLPLCCLFTDPGIFRDAGFGGRISPLSFSCYVFIAWQMMILIASWFLTSAHPRWAAFLSGNLIAGAAFAAVIAAFLIVPALIGSLFLLGLPGLTPCLTARVYFRAYQSCSQITARWDKDQETKLRACGMITSIVPPVGAHFAWMLLANQQNVVY